MSIINGLQKASVKVVEYGNKAYDNVGLTNPADSKLKAFYGDNYIRLALVILIVLYCVFFFWFIPREIIGTNKYYEPYSYFSASYFIFCSLLLVLLLTPMKELKGKPDLLSFINKTNEPFFVWYGVWGVRLLIAIMIVLLCCIKDNIIDSKRGSNDFVYIFIPVFTFFIIIYAIFPTFINYFLYYLTVGTFVYIVYAIEVAIFLTLITPSMLINKIFPGLLSTIKNFFINFLATPFTSLYTTIKENLQTNPEFKDEFYKQLKKTGIFSIFFLFVILIIFYAKNDKRSTSNMMYFYAFIIIIPILIGLFVSSLLVSDNGLSIYTRLFLLFGGLVAGGFAYCYYKQFNPVDNVYIYSVGNLLLILMVIVLLGAAFIIFSNYLKKQRGIIGFIVNLIFFIPCLFADFIQYIKEQIGITPSTVYILFIIEVLLIIAYIYLPSMIQFLLHKNSTKLQRTPFYLNQQNDVAIPGSDFLKIKSVYNPEKQVYNNNYAFSFWVYLNTNDYFLNTSSELNDLGKINEKVIFNFANGRPKLVYVNDEKNNDIYRIYLINKSDTPGTISNKFIEFNGLPKQRWNFFVINYTSSSADVFINGELKGSIEFTENNFPEDISDINSAVVGQENGLNGAIKETYYYNKPLSKFEIVNMYNIFNTFGDF
jgi:hypothetical protein